MASSHLTRRGWLAGSAALAWPAWAADDTLSARVRPLAAKSAFLDVTLAGQRLVAVGERGHVLLSDDQGQQWRQARAVPTRATLTALHAVNEQTLWAVGHGGVMLRSTDGGEQWALVPSGADAKDVLLSIRVEPDGRGLAVGGFGLALATRDGGASWKRQELVAGEAGERHLNRIFTAGPSGSTWLIAAEGGQVLRSADGVRWTAVATPYKGSLWTGLQLQGGELLAGGMRGNVVRSSDDGKSWVHSAIAQAGSITAGAVLRDGRSVLVGVDGTLVVADAAGRRFDLQRLEDRATLTATLALPGGDLLAASTTGMRVLAVPR